MKGAKNPVNLDNEWKIEDDLRTLCQAEKIKNDPKRMKACQEMAQKRMVEMGGIASEGSEK